jgi:MFS family permease
MDSYDQPAEANEAENERKPWTTLILLGLAQFMVILDITVVNVALPSIAEELAFAEGDLQWVISAYVLFTGGLLMLGGRAADLFGRRRVLLCGLATFTVASLASGLASSPEALVAARAVQGLGAAMLTPGALSIVTTAYEGSQRTAALAAWSAIGSAGAAAGVVLGGVLTSGLGWEWVFFINVPVGLATGIGVLAVVPSTPAAATGRRLDVLGAATAVAGLVVLLYGIEGTGEHGWGSALTVSLLLAAAVLLATFVAVERRVGEPVVPPATWGNRPLVSGIALIFVATAIDVSAAAGDADSTRNDRSCAPSIPARQIVVLPTPASPASTTPAGATGMRSSNLATAASSCSLPMTPSAVIVSPPILGPSTRPGKSRAATHIQHRYAAPGGLEPETPRTVDLRQPLQCCHCQSRLGLGGDGAPIVGGCREKGSLSRVRRASAWSLQGGTWLSGPVA